MQATLAEGVVKPALSIAKDGVVNGGKTYQQVDSNLKAAERVETKCKTLRGYIERETRLLKRDDHFEEECETVLINLPIEIQEIEAACKNIRQTRMVMGMLRSTRYRSEINDLDKRIDSCSVRAKAVVKQVKDSRQLMTSSPCRVAPDKITKLFCAAKDRTLVITWNNPNPLSTATHYQLYYSYSSKAGVEGKMEIPSTQRRFVISEEHIYPWRWYDVKVRAKNNGACGLWSESEMVCLKCGVPDPPMEKLSVQANSNNSIEIDCEGKDNIIQSCTTTSCKIIGHFPGKFPSM